MTEDANFFNFLAEGNIICDSRSVNSAEVINELVMRITRNQSGLNSANIISSLNSREEVFPTVVAPGLALPHARLDNIDRMIVAMACSTAGFDFGTPDMGPVYVAILLLTPKSNPGIHLQVLAGLAKDFCNPERIRKVAALESPREVLDYFDSSKVEIADYLRAGDVMSRELVTLEESDTLQTAIDTFAKKHATDILVVDDENDLRGVVKLEDVLNFSLPDHLLWMDELTPIRKFQPFAEMLRTEKETKLADILNQNYTAVDVSVPAIQLAKLFCVEKPRQIIVTERGKPVGVVTLSGFVIKLFWA